MGHIYGETDYYLESEDINEVRKDCEVMLTSSGRWGNPARPDNVSTGVEVGLDNLISTGKHLIV